MSLTPSKPRSAALPVAGDDHTDVTSVPAPPWEGEEFPQEDDDAIGHDPDGTKQTGVAIRIDDFDLAPGTALGEYRIQSKIGQGGMGVVFSAVHPLIGKRAAIKILKKELCADPHQLERFIDEARVVNQIGHPNIVDVFAFGEMPDGRSYFVMEWLKGETLRARIARSALDAAEVNAIVRPLARALEAAHEKGVIHRDLKPDNVFLVAVRGEPPTVKLLDFGIAKLASNDHRVEKTATGAIVGTPQYIAPEQAKGYAIDHRADIYALGGILYELLTGRPPFVADNAMEMVAKHLMETPLPPSHFAPGVSPELDALVLRMLAKTPDGRPSLTEVCDVVERAKLHDRSGPVERLSLDAITPSGVLLAPGAVTRPAYEARVSQPLAEEPLRRRMPLWIAIVGVPLAGLAAFLVVSATGGGADDDKAQVEPSAAVAETAAPTTGSNAAIEAPSTIASVATPPPVTPPSVTPPPVTPPPVAKPPIVSSVPVRPVAAAKAQLRLVISGARAPEIFIDGKRSSAEVKLRPGLHEVEIRAARMQTQKVQVDVAPNGTTKRITLVPVPRPKADPPRRQDPVKDDGSELLSPGSLNSPARR